MDEVLCARVRQDDMLFLWAMPEDGRFGMDDMLCRDK